MGAWGPAIFSDDVACDVRNAYRERVADGMDPVAATDEMIPQWTADLPPDDNDVFVFWLALAATQSKAGRLEDRVRDRALKIIDSGANLDLWEEQGLAKQRQKHLLKLRDQLNGPQPKPKKIRVERPQIPPWSPGNFVSYKLQSGQLAILYVEACEYGFCYVSALDWIGLDLPNEQEIRALPKKAIGATKTATQFGLYTMKKRGIPYDRLTVLDFTDTEATEYDGGGVAFEWDSLDYQLDDHWGWT